MNMENQIAPVDPADLQVESITRTERWDALEDEWRRLFEASPTATPPLRWEWLREWWRIYGPEYAGQTGGLRVLTARHEGVLAGALPLYLGAARGTLGVRRLGFLSSGEDEAEETFAEYMDLLHLPGMGDVCARALAPAALDLRATPWDELDLRHVTDGSALLNWESLFQSKGQQTELSREIVCPYADLSAGYEAYTERLSSHFRKRMRQLLRAVEKEGMGFTLAEDETQSMRFLEDLTLLHQRRWESAGKPGCFAAPRFAEFHRTLCRLLVPKRQAVLARLAAADDTPLVVLYGFRARSEYHFYQSGITLEETGRLESPGIAANLLLMQRLAPEGVALYDFLGGASAYKERLATDSRRLARLRVLRPTLRGATQRATGLLRKAVGKLRDHG